MPRPLPRRVSSSLPPPPRRAYAPSLDDAEAADYFQDRGRRSSHTGHGYDDGYNRQRRAESAHNHPKHHDREKYRPSSRDSYHRPRHASTSRYHDPRDDTDLERGRARSRPTQSLDRHHRRSYTSRASSKPSVTSSPSSSRSSSTDSSLSSHHHYGGGHRHRRKSTASSKQPRQKPTDNERYYPPSASRPSRSTAPPKRGPLNRLRSLSLPAVASKLTGSQSRSPSPSHHRNPLKKLNIKSPRDQAPEKRSPKEVFFRAAQCAAEAGAMAALKLRDDPSPWIGPNGKAPKVAAAALSAAAVDTFMEQRHPKRKGGIRHTMMRQVTQMAIGGLVKHAPMDSIGKTGSGGGGGGGGKGGRARTGGGGGGRRRK
ncbi:hypothetical protein V8F33_011553 [Rhypophila sp. PSN 637]